ncbi:MAG: hypothetical protein INQ03_04185 [Candidatus Heimdallarchaeota archaeon]|nr:hypothetical protein [Candidatus Heimdallarchaeota archaeon]
MRKLDLQALLLVIILIQTFFMPKATVILILPSDFEINLYDSSFSKVNNYYYTNISSTFSYDTNFKKFTNIYNHVDDFNPDTFYGIISEDSAHYKIYKLGIENKELQMDIINEVSFSDYTCILGMHGKDLYYSEPITRFRSLSQLNKYYVIKLNETQEIFTIPLTQNVVETYNETNPIIINIKPIMFKDILFTGMLVAHGTEENNHASALYFQQTNLTTMSTRSILHKFDPSVDMTKNNQNVGLGNLVFKLIEVDSNRIIMVSEAGTNSYQIDDSNLHTYLINFEPNHIENINIPSDYLGTKYNVKLLGIRQNILYLYFMQKDSDFISYSDIYIYDLSSNEYQTIVDTSHLFSINNDLHLEENIDIYTEFEYLLLNNFLVQITEYSKSVSPSNNDASSNIIMILPFIAIFMILIKGKKRERNRGLLR